MLHGNGNKIVRRGQRKIMMQGYFSFDREREGGDFVKLFSYPIFCYNIHILPDDAIKCQGVLQRGCEILSFVFRNFLPHTKIDKKKSLECANGWDKTKNIYLHSKRQIDCLVNRFFLRVSLYFDYRTNLLVWNG